MSLLLGLVLGCVVTLVVTQVVERGRAARRRKTVAPPAPAKPLPKQREARFELTPLPQVETDLETLSEQIGAELADLATAIEGHAQLLCESVGQPQRVTAQSERLWGVVNKLRGFSEKVLSSARTDPIQLGPTNIRDLLARMRPQLEDCAGDSLQVKCAAATSLPLAMSDSETLRKVLLFVVEALLELEPDAGVIEVRASTHVAHDAGPNIELTVQVESESREGERQKPKRTMPLAHNAARNLAEGLGAAFALEHRPGLRARARIRLRAAPPEAVPVLATAPNSPVETHAFGGVLILDDEPAVREMIKMEVAKTGRRIVCCSDGASARSLFHATPERFELLILEKDSRRETGALLAEEALSLCPDARVLLLTCGTETPPAALAGAVDRCRQLHKPFGATELRDAISSMLGIPVPTPQVG